MKLKGRVAFMAGTNQREEETGVLLGSFHFSCPAQYSSDVAVSQHRGESSLGTVYNGRAGDSIMDRSPQRKQGDWGKTLLALRAPISATQSLRRGI
jgi:hypothetical protein